MSCESFDPSESDRASWEIAQVTLKDEGAYECIAISSAGTGRAHTFLDVSGKHRSRFSHSVSFITGHFHNIHKYLFDYLLLMQIFP